MPVSYQWEDKGIFYLGEGEVTVQEFIDVMLEASGSPNFDRIQYAISDWSRSIPLDFDTEMIEKIFVLTDALYQYNPNVINGIVMAPDEESQALAALYVMMQQDKSRQAEIFHTLEDCRQWVSDTLAKQENSQEKN